MTQLFSFPRVALLGAFLFGIQGAAHAAPAVPPEQIDAYKQMCMKATDMPKPYGEWDLKGNPKLGKYCDCFAPQFIARMMKSAGSAPPTLEESNKQELALRNTCRKQVGLPAAVES